MSDLRRDMAEALHNIYKVRKPRALSMAGHLFYCTGISDEIANLTAQNKHLEQSPAEYKEMVGDLCGLLGAVAGELSNAVEGYDSENAKRNRKLCSLAFVKSMEAESLLAKQLQENR
tara:strand:- start:564 stop:914 length:351 start_codon:yes stop_codon:yes gene_type:complete